MRIVLGIVRLSIVECEVLNGCLCGSGPSTDVTISDRRDQRCADLVRGSNVSHVASTVQLHFYVFIVFNILSSVFLIQSLRKLL